MKVSITDATSARVGYVMSLAMRRGAERLIDDSTERQRGHGDAQPSAALSIVGSVAYLEAFINEYLDKLSERMGNLMRPGIKTRQGYAPLLGELALAIWWDEDTERSTNLLAKYKRVFRALSPGEVDFGREPWQSARDLIDMRNELVHAKPHWRGQDLPPHQLEERLLRRLDNPEHRAGLGWPTGYLDAQAARWALEVADSLTDATTSLIAEAKGTVVPPS